MKVLMVSSRGSEIADRLVSVADLSVAGSIEDAREILLTNEPPDAIFLEAGPGRFDPERIRKIRETASDVPILLMSADPTPEFLQQAVDAGAVGVVGDPPSADQVRDAIHVVKAGGSYLDPAHTKGIFEAIGSAVPTRDPAITKREMEVLRLLFEGMSARQIATRLGLSERTVNTHVANVYRKLGASNRIEAIRIAMRMGMLSE